MIIRDIARRIILNMYGYFSTPRNGIHILNGHRMTLQNPKPQIFEQQLTYLSNKVRFIRFEDAVQRSIRNENPTEPLVAFSFDDGFEEHYTMIAPVLEKFGTNATFFINPNFAQGNESYIQNFTKEKVLTLNYMLDGWSELLNYRKDGRYTIDNLEAERAVRLFTVNRKNSLFYSSEEGVDVATTYLTIIETAKMHGLEVRDYLAHVFREIMNGNKDCSIYDPEAFLA